MNDRQQSGLFRALTVRSGQIDFCSNDYLGLAKMKYPDDDSSSAWLRPDNGATGSRLLSGNSDFFMEAEEEIAAFHDAEAALLFNSGYDANLGLLGFLPQKGDTVIYDFLCHASLRDGIRLSKADAFPFIHNDLDSLRHRLARGKGKIFVVTESLFSMDGDQAPLTGMVDACLAAGAHLIVDEAHATGVIGEKGAGLCQMLGLQEKIFARVHTFGKALGCHGAVVVGSGNLKSYLVNFANPLIYSTALSPHTVMTVLNGYRRLPMMGAERRELVRLADAFQALQTGFRKLRSDSPIQGVIVPGNDNARSLSRLLSENGFDARPILHPTVPKGKERLRITLHAYNTTEKLNRLGMFLR